MQYDIMVWKFWLFYVNPWEKWDWLNAHDSASLSDSNTKLDEKSNPIMQFTWLLDKNWKEIYEGDIVSVSNKYLKNSKPEDYEIKQVQLNNQRWCWNYYLNENDLHWNVWIYDAVEIIWNIYENPELLNK